MIYFYLLIFSVLNFFLLQKYRRIVIKKKLLDSRNIKFGYNPTPTGSGIIILIVFFIINIFFFYLLGENFVKILPNKFFVFYLSVLILGSISFIDDFKPVSAILRLLIQITVIFFSLSLLDLGKLDILLKLKLFLFTIIWIYLLNITNFVDGCDGFLTSILIFFFLGIVFVFEYLNFDLTFTYYVSISCIFLLLSFILLNKPIAKIYMGDTGSVFFGYILGFVFLDMCLSYNLWYVVLGLFSYPITDCSKALFIKTIINKHYPWERMDDYSFLKPIIRNKLKQKDIFKLILVFSIINYLIVILGITLDTKLFVILNYILAILLTRIFEKNNDFDLKNILNFKII